jgi:hypothetical protein
MYSAASGLARTDRQSGAGRFKFHDVEGLARQPGGPWRTTHGGAEKQGASE